MCKGSPGKSGGIPDTLSWGILKFDYLKLEYSKLDDFDAWEFEAWELEVGKPRSLEIFGVFVLILEGNHLNFPNGKLSSLEILKLGNR